MRVAWTRIARFLEWLTVLLETNPPFISPLPAFRKYMLATRNRQGSLSRLPHV